MAKCDVCGKGVSFGIAVSHSHRRNNRAWKANVRTVRVKTPGGAKTMHVCASCLRSNRVERAELNDYKRAVTGVVTAFLFVEKNKLETLARLNCVFLGG